MIAVGELMAADLAELVAQPRQQAERDHADAGALLVAGPGFAVRAGGRVIAACGFYVNHPGHATAWALVADGKGMAMVALTRAVRRAIAAASWRRIDTVVRADWPAAAAWAGMAGFALEGRLSAYYPDGGDALLLAHIRAAG